MSIQTTCKRCGSKLEGLEEWVGKQLTCPTCGATVQIPLAPIKAFMSNQPSPPTTVSPSSVTSEQSQVIALSRGKTISSIFNRFRGACPSIALLIAISATTFLLIWLT